jgi:hypothetical protein
VSDEAVSGCSTKLSRALRESRDNARTILKNGEWQDTVGLRMHNLYDVQLILYSQVSLKQSSELIHGVDSCPSRLGIVEGGSLGRCRGAW